MFQNISNEEMQEEKEYRKRIDLKSLFTVNDIVLYIITFLISMVNFDEDFSPFGLAIFAAACSNRIPVGIIYIMVTIRNFNKIWIN